MTANPFKGLAAFIYLVFTMSRRPPTPSLPHRGKEVLLGGGVVRMV